MHPFSFLSGAGLAICSTLAVALGLQELPKAEAQKEISAAHILRLGRPTSDAGTIAQCMVSCEVGAKHCARLVSEGKKDHAAAMALLADCATVCSAASALSARGSALAETQLEACAKACETCAAGCDKLQDPMMQECARICRQCTIMCRDLLNASDDSHK